MTKLDFSAVQKQIEKGQKFLVTAHRYPDTDAVGSCLAMAQYIQSFSKDVYVWLDSNYLEQFNFLPQHQLLHSDFPEHYKFDTCIVLDCSNLERVNYHHKVENSAHAYNLINIDHHSDNSSFADINVTGNISSVGEMLYHFFRDYDFSINADVATCLYAAIAFDTGRFAFSNVTEDTLSAAAHLVSKGAKPYALSQAMDENKSAVDFELIKIAIDNLKIKKELGYAYTHIPRSSPKGSIKIIDFIRQLGEDLDVFIVFQELKSNLVKVNLRSKHQVDVSVFAQKFGGGGHQRAAGIVLDQSLEESIAVITDHLESL